MWNNNYTNILKSVTRSFHSFHLKSFGAVLNIFTFSFLNHKIIKIKKTKICAPNKVPPWADHLSSPLRCHIFFKIGALLLRQKVITGKKPIVVRPNHFLLRSEPKKGFNFFFLVINVVL